MGESSLTRDDYREMAHDLRRSLVELVTLSDDEHPNYPGEKGVDAVLSRAYSALDFSAALSEPQPQEER